MELTEEQIKLLSEHRCFKCKAKQVRDRILGPFGMMNSWRCKRCIE